MQLDAEPARRSEPVREFLLELGCRLRDLRLRLSERHAGLETSRRSEEMRLIDGVGVDLKRRPDVGRVEELRRIEVRRHHADHDVRISAQRNRFADDAAVGGESARPPSVREHRDVRTIRAIFLRGEGAPDQRCAAQQTKERSTHLPRVHLLRQIRARVVDEHVPESSSVLHNRSSAAANARTSQAKSRDRNRWATCS